MERFWSKADVGDSTSCWEWRANVVRGYGHFWAGGKTVKAHRFAYELAIGPIPEGHDVHHTCGNSTCVNPAHLETVTRREHLVERHPATFVAINAAKRYCKHGHALEGDNIMWRRNGTYRKCRKCHRRESREGMQRQRLRHVLVNQRQ